MLLAVVMLVLPSAATAAKKCHRPKPDLKIVVLRAGFGDPAYAIVGTDGVMEPIEVMVGIRNQGDAAAGRSAGCLAAAGLAINRVPSLRSR